MGTEVGLLEGMQASFFAPIEQISDESLRFYTPRELLTQHLTTAGSPIQPAGGR